MLPCWLACKGFSNTNRSSTFLMWSCTMAAKQVDIYVTLGLSRDCSLERATGGKGKFSYHLIPLFSSPKVSLLVVEGFRIVQELSDWVVPGDLKYKNSSACLKWQGSKKFSVYQGEKKLALSNRNRNHKLMKTKQHLRWSWWSNPNNITLVIVWEWGSII